MWNRLLASLQNRLKPLISHEGGRQFRDWCQTPQGSKFVQSQNTAWVNITEQLGSGYHFMELGLPLGENAELYNQYSHCFSFNPDNADQPGNFAIANFEELPLPSDTIDTVLLNCALDYGEQPHKILSEASRVLLPGGYMIIVTVNPLSLFGLYARVKRLLSKQPLWQRHMFRRGRILDWLKLLHLQPVYCVTTGYFLPSKSANLLNKFPSAKKFFSSGHLPFAACQILVAKKVVSRPIGLAKSNWQIAAAGEAAMHHMPHNKIEQDQQVLH